MSTVKIIDASNPQRVGEYIDSNLIDIAYVDNIKEDTLAISLEDSIDLDCPEDKAWITELLIQALVESGENSAKIQFPPPAQD